MHNQWELMGRRSHSSQSLGFGCPVWNGPIVAFGSAAADDRPRPSSGELTAEFGHKRSVNFIIKTMTMVRFYGRRQSREKMR